MHMENEEIFSQYADVLGLKIRNRRNLNYERILLSKFQTYLSDRKPSADLAKGFLATYTNRSPATLLRYSSTIKGFMKWLGEPLEDLKLAQPKTLPPYIEDRDIEKLMAAIGDKKNHKRLITRDLLIVKLTIQSGLRRGELANLEIGDVHADFITVREGKGLKDRTIPLPDEVAQELNKFCRNRLPTEKVFGLSGPSITNKVNHFAKKAGLNNLHAHSLRHKYATDLLKSGADIRDVQILMGHSDLNTTQVYLGVSQESLRGAVDRLGKPKESRVDKGKEAEAFLVAGTTFVMRPAPYDVEIWPGQTAIEKKICAGCCRKKVSFRTD